MPGMEFKKELFVRKTNAQGHCSENHLGVLVAFPVKGCCEGAEARKNVFGKPDVRLVCVALTAYLIAFLSGFRKALDVGV